MVAGPEDYIQTIAMQENRIKALESTVKVQEGQIGQLEFENKKLKEEIDIDNKLLADRQRILDACPCPEHGSCVPHVLDELARLKSFDKIMSYEGRPISDDVKVTIYIIKKDEMISPGDRVLNVTMRMMESTVKQLVMPVREAIEVHVSDALTKFIESVAEEKRP